jgi:Protein of unknown function (DUF998)
MNIKLSPTLIGALIAAAAMTIGPTFNVEGYSSVRHTTSELGAQDTPGAWIMNAGFIAFGAGVLIDALRGLHAARLPAVLFMVFGVSMIMTGVFSHRPIDAGAPYSILEDDLHSLFSSAVGVAFAFGVLAFMFVRRGVGPVAAHWAAVAAATILPLAMNFYPGVEGVLQRSMFLVSFVWLACFLPRLARGQQVASPEIPFN